MSTPRPALLLLAALLSLAAPAARAQLVNDGETNVLDGVTNILAEPLIVGTNAPFTLLVLTNGASLTSSNGVIGETTIAVSNRVEVAGAGSQWTTDGTNSITVGADGSHNALVIREGALVDSYRGVLGLTSNAQYNTALVDGPGSRWNLASILTIGQSGSFNSLLISNGGSVTSGSGRIGAVSPLASNNLALVTGAGSVWSNAGTLRLRGFNNALLVTEGGLVQASDVYVGDLPGSRSNTVTVTGAGSLLESSGWLRVGDAGGTNSLHVLNGGKVTSLNAGLGYGTNFGALRKNDLVVDGSGSELFVANTFFVGYWGSSNTLWIRNGGRVVSRSGVAGVTNGSDGNFISVDGAGSLWSNDVLTVGVIGGRNTLVVTNGGQVVARFFSLGTFRSFQNTGIVAGAGSILSVASNLTIDSSSSRFEIREGGRVESRHAIIGDVSRNQATVAGAGSVWSNEFSLVVGYGGASNQLLITNGGAVFSENATIGRNATGNTNRVVVEGSGSLWSNRARLIVGSNGFANQVSVLNGGELHTGSAILGFSSTADSNRVVVSGAGARWVNTQSIQIGLSGGTNELNVGTGGLVLADSIRIGSESNRLLLNGGQVLLTNSTGTGELNVRGGVVQMSGGVLEADRLIVTNLGSIRPIFRLDGGTLITHDGHLTNNQRLIIGNGAGEPATWDVRAGNSNFTLHTNFVLGAGGSGNQLLVTNGQTLLVTGTGANYFGSNSSHNLLLLSSSGLQLTGSLVMAITSSWNHLILTNGAKALIHSTGSPAAGAVSFAVGFSGNSNLVRVAGTDSELYTTGAIKLGDSGLANQIPNPPANFNRLIIQDGAHMQSSTLFLPNGGGTYGYATSVVDGAFNEVLVTGAGSFWSNRGDIRINGNSNLVTVSDGAAIATEGRILLGGSAFSTGNSIELVNGSISSVGLWVGTNRSRANSVTLRSNSTWNVGGGQFIWGDAGIGDVLIIDASSSFTNIGGLTLDQNDTLFRMTNGPAGYTLNDFTSAQFQFSPSGVDGLIVGRRGTNVQLLLSDYRLTTTSGAIGFFSNALSNQVTVSGHNSSWVITSNLTVGRSGAASLLNVNDSGVVETSSLALGLGSSSPRNRILVSDGRLIVTNSSGTGIYNLLRGTNEFIGGFMDVDHLLMTNAVGGFDFHAGLLTLRQTTVSNGQTFIVGNGTSTATLHLAGQGIHQFGDGLVIASNALLKGDGTMIGTVTNFGTIAPGNSAGAITIHGDLRLRDSAGMAFEIGGLIPTNQHDIVTVTNFVEFAGTLSLSLLPGFLPAAADSFALMSFGSASGSFANVSGGRVSLTNNLASFAVTMSATNLVLSGAQYTDTDGDGQGDLQEQAAGTAAADPASALAILSVTVNGAGHSVVRFQSVTGKSYRVEYSDNFATWNVATGATFTNPSPGVSEWVDDGTLTGGPPAAGRAYRIGLQ
jgi:T5SS/PEP-CTERM-associated repeat protein